MTSKQLTDLIIDNLTIQDIEEHDTESGRYCDSVIFKAKCEKYGLGKDKDISIEGYFTITYTEKNDQKEFFSFDLDSFEVFNEDEEIFNYDENAVYNELYSLASRY